MISKLSAQRNLLIVWVIGTVIFVLIAIFQQLVTFYSKNADEFWDWFLPNFFPTLTMILGAYISLSQQDSASDKKMPRFNYMLCLCGIITYFLIFLIILITTNLAIENTRPKITPMVHLKNYSKIISTFHSIATLLLGLFFVQGKSQDKAIPEKKSE